MGDPQLCIRQGGPWLLFTASWGALVEGMGGSQGWWAWRPEIDLGGSGECCVSEQSVDLERLLHPFCKKAQCKGDGWGVRKSSPISPWRIHRHGDLRL